MDPKAPGVFFLKNFFYAVFFSSCGQSSEERGPYAETRFLPASTSQTLQLESKQDEHLVLDGPQQKLLDEMFRNEILEKTLVAMGHEPGEVKKIKPQLWGKIVNGSVCLRFYSTDSDFTVRFLRQWLSVYEVEKNRIIELECHRKINSLEKELEAITGEQTLLKDSLTWVKDKYNLLVSPEEIARALERGTYQPDSSALMTFNLLQARFGKTFEYYARVKQKKDDVQADLLVQTLHFYMVDAPHFVKVSSKKT